MRPTDEEYLNHLDHSIKEIGRGGWQEEVTNEFKRCGWGHVYHTWNSRNSPKGFPDVVICGASRVIAIELKVGNNKPSDEQIGWLKAFKFSGALTFAFWPRHREVVRLIASGKWGVNALVETGRLHVYTKQGG